MLVAPPPVVAVCLYMKGLVPDTKRTCYFAQWAAASIPNFGPCALYRIPLEQLERHELQAALLLYTKSMAKVIPTVVAHQFKGMGDLVDSDQVKEEIVTVVDEVRHVYERIKGDIFPNT